MLELILIMMSLFYTAFLSPAWMWCFPLALAVMAIKHYFRTRK